MPTGRSHSLCTWPPGDLRAPHVLLEASPRSSQVWPPGGGHPWGHARGGATGPWRARWSLSQEGPSGPPHPPLESEPLRSCGTLAPVLVPHRLCWHGQWLQQPLQGHLRQHDHLPEEEGGTAAAAAGEEATQGATARVQRADQEDEGGARTTELLVLARLGVLLGGARHLGAAGRCARPPARSALTQAKRGPHSRLGLGGGEVHPDSADTWGRAR